MAQINKPNQYFDTKLHTGTGATHNITGLNFAPDFVWLKSRTQGGVGYNGMHFLFDTIRGATKRLRSNDTSAEAISSASLTSFNSDGYTLGTDDIVNYSGDSFVGWSWLAGGTASSNTDGSITSTVSANTTSGFSIVSYTGNGTAGATVGHGLGSAPYMIIVKSRTNGTSYWRVGHQSLSWTNEIFLNDTAGTNASSGAWNNTAPTSTVFSLGIGGYGNASGENFIAYCFAEKKGFSKFGSYTGNGSSDGPFVYTGFKPAFVVLKRSDSSPFDWFMHDNKRNGFNPDNDYLQANTSSSETNFDGLIDFVSNGFKIRTTSTAYNASGGTYIYMCFAENPLVGTNNIPATAR